jgi:hypothetical protein
MGNTHKQNCIKIDSINSNIIVNVTVKMIYAREPVSHKSSARNWLSWKKVGGILLPFMLKSLTEVDWPNILSYF